MTSLQMYEEIRGRLPAVNQSTVYRALERLARGGRISVSDMGTGAAVYELVEGSRHHHLVCQNCGAVYTLGPGGSRSVSLSGVSVRAAIRSGPTT